MEVSVVIATYGASEWERIAELRAVPSVPEDIPLIRVHDQTLAKARNAGLEQVETEFVIHLDADDELGEGYIEAMAKGSADLRAPSRQTLKYGEPYGPCMVPRVWGHDHDCTGECLRYGNWMVIGTCVKAELARSVGGWEEFEWSEDWALFARCWKAGGSVEAIPEAIYLAHWKRGSRNRVSTSVSLHWHRTIEAAVWPDEPSVL